MKQTRRKFINKAGTVVLATGLSSFSSLKNQQKKKPVFIHHVFFWLKNADNISDRDKLVEGLLKLSNLKTIRSFRIGKPADTNRDVIERGYAISWLLFFNSDADQASYQSDPIHLQFVKDYSHLWSKVIVYDSVDI
jgi:hypothetical protein